MEQWPKHIQILCARYAVRYVPILVCDAKHMRGLIDHTERTVKVGTSEGTGEPCPSNAVFDCLLHEVIHGINEEVPLLRDCLREGTEETFVGSLAAVLAKTLVESGIVILPKERP